jgi:hypothetical protein
MLDELDKLTLAYKRSEDDLRKENLLLKIKLDQTLSNVDDLTGLLES